MNCEVAEWRKGIIAPLTAHSREKLRTLPFPWWFGSA